MTDSFSAKHLMEDERFPTDIPRSAGPDPGDSRHAVNLSANLRARMEKLSDWRIDPSLIRFPEEPCESHGGHATVSKAFLPDDEDDEDDDDDDEDDEDDNDDDEDDEDDNDDDDDDDDDDDGDEDDDDGEEEEGSSWTSSCISEEGRKEEGELGDEQKVDEQEHESDGNNICREKVGRGRFLCSFGTTVERT
ncbi:hypothetical protein FRC04_009821 [Tulasnella sp. 424]|nr:hypothetical protein FRC04_009821 [Tulasnella sp. 424]KAG8972890.1 hypothetical protein FRC05_009443 [Tulasnella sp. 425]